MLALRRDAVKMQCKNDDSNTSCRWLPLQGRWFLTCACQGGADGTESLIPHEVIASMASVSSATLVMASVEL